jgi:hypothetical protein
MFLRLVFVKGALTDPVPPTYVSSLLASFLFLDHCNDLFIRESCLHLSVRVLGGLYTNLEEF